MEIPQIYAYNLIILNSFWSLRLDPLLQPNSDAIVSHKTKKKQRQPLRHCRLLKKEVAVV